MVTLQSERRRIALHLAQAEAALRARSVGHLPRAIRRVRAALIDALAAYRLRGVFPHNHDFPNSREPYFIDAHGTRCAMAHLLELVGADALVARVARTSNNARVKDLAADSEFLLFLGAMGFTVAEAARVKPEYCDAKNSDCLCYGRQQQVAAALGIVTMRDEQTQSGTLEIQVVYDTSSHFEVGQAVSAPYVGPVGDRYLVTVTTPEQETPSLIPLDEKGLRSCGEYPSAPLLPAETAAKALLASDCEATLAAADPRWAESVCGADGEGACSASGRSFTPDASHVLLALGVVLALERRRRSRKAHLAG